ncbi:MAG TPA: putative collagen-binding domain-containing protein, partial [Cyclobacteriaceae bacterium]|nr:putative collagen-binding domain-containing protein [Cyclobacteriaceae bacterium]
FNDPDWKNHLNTQGSRDMGRLNSFIRSIPWWNLVPSGLNDMRNLITTGSSMDSTSNYVAAAATPAGTLLVAYIPPAHSGSIIVDMEAMKGSAQARWFDPTSGKYTPVVGSPLKNKGMQQFTPPGSNSAGQNDWVLVLESTAETRTTDTSGQGR